MGMLYVHKRLLERNVDWCEGPGGPLLPKQVSTAWLAQIKACLFTFFLFSSLRVWIGCDLLTCTSKVPL